MSYLQRRNIDAIGFPWDNDEDMLLMFQALRARQVQAVVLDR